MQQQQYNLMTCLSTREYLSIQYVEAEEESRLCFFFIKIDTHINFLIHVYRIYVCLQRVIFIFRVRVLCVVWILILSSTPLTVVVCSRFDRMG